jgi:carboxyl-terminal processing protease
MRKPGLRVFVLLLAVAAVLFAWPVAGGAQSSQRSSGDSELIGEIYQLLQTTFYRPISGRAIRAGADAAILDYARKRGARAPRIAAAHDAGGVTPSLISADAARASKMYRLDAQATFYAAAAGMAAGTRDRWTEFFTPREWASFDAPLDPKAIFGIGVLLDIDPVTHFARSFYVIPGGPADNAGISSGDLITAVDGKSTRGMVQSQVSKLLRGPPDTNVRVATKADDGGEREVSLARSGVRPPTVIVKLLPNKVGYILVGIFAEPTAGEFTQALHRLKREGARALVVDLRDDGGGYISAAISIASHFFSSAPIVTTLDRDGAAITESSNDEEPQITIPVAVLVNGFTASASEILAGALQDNHAAIVIGTRTFGKGVEQTITRLPNGAAIKITTARYLTPANRDLNGTGLEPDVLVAPNKGATVGDPRSDAALQSALAYLERQVTLRDGVTSDSAYIAKVMAGARSAVVQGARIVTTDGKRTLAQGTDGFTCGLSAKGYVPIETPCSGCVR